MLVFCGIAHLWEKLQLKATPGFIKPPLLSFEGKKTGSNSSTFFRIAHYLGFWDAKSSGIALF